MLSATVSENPQKWLKLIGVNLSNITKNPEVCGNWYGSTAQCCWTQHPCSFVLAFSSSPHCIRGAVPLGITFTYKVRRKAKIIFLMLNKFSWRAFRACEQDLVGCLECGSIPSIGFLVLFFKFLQEPQEFHQLGAIFMLMQASDLKFFNHPELKKRDIIFLIIFLITTLSSFSNSGQNFFYSIFPLRRTSQFHFPAFHLGITIKNQINGKLAFSKASWPQHQCTALSFKFIILSFFPTAWSFLFHFCELSCAFQAILFLLQFFESSSLPYCLAQSLVHSIYSKVFFFPSFRMWQNGLMSNTWEKLVQMSPF